MSCFPSWQWCLQFSHAYNTSRWPTFFFAMVSLIFLNISSKLGNALSCHPISNARSISSSLFPASLTIWFTSSCPNNVILCCFLHFCVFGILLNIPCDLMDLSRCFQNSFVVFWWVVHQPFSSLFFPPLY